MFFFVSKMLLFLLLLLFHISEKNLLQVNMIFAFILPHSFTEGGKHEASVTA